MPHAHTTKDTEEHEGVPSTQRVMPFFSLVTLTFISQPIFTPATFM